MSVNKLVLKWKRPESIEYPKVWLRFKARDLNSDNLVEYRIEDLVEERVEDAFKHMRENYFKDEPVSQAMGGYKDWNLFEDYKFGWIAVLAQKTPIVCYKEGSDEIVGVNWTFINTREDPVVGKILANSKSPVTKIQFGVSMKLYENFDPFDHYGVDKFMGSLGLSVDGKYRGRSVGDQILAARKVMCKEFGVKLTHTIFSSDYSSRNAENVGFKTDVSMSYGEAKKVYPEYEQSLSTIKSAELCLKSLVI